MAQSVGIFSDGDSREINLLQEAGIEVLSQLSQLTGTLFTAPTGIATGSYQHLLSDWLGRQWETSPPSIYFSESKLQTWSSLTDFLEDTLKSVRKQLSPLFKELQKNVSGRMIASFRYHEYPRRTNIFIFKMLKQVPGF